MGGERGKAERWNDKCAGGSCLHDVDGVIHRHALDNLEQDLHYVLALVGVVVVKHDAVHAWLLLLYNFAVPSIPIPQIKTTDTNVQDAIRCGIPMQKRAKMATYFPFIAE